ncbi:MAG: NADH/ubiquinone/plastoquinone (complex I) [Candidatus Margulisbacteria bacterium]|nr:NADH/ubiquinone/plastoquinone (complex I) [Candidatus Margulisiibacteriota bacterium]MBU1617714.1 NADH/ubiquinone/plastoquinone (complex I) [Candidatus Margulisiibacteriota bacterium]
MTFLLPAFIVIPLASALLVLLLSRQKKPGVVAAANLAVFLLFIFSLGLYFVRPYNSIVLFNVERSLLLGGSCLVLDGLNHLFLLMSNFIGWLAMIYSIKYMQNYPKRESYFALLLIMIAGINGLLLTGNIFTLFVFMEIASFSAYALIIFGDNKRGIEAAFKCFILGEISSLLILIGIGIIFGLTNSFNMAVISQSFAAVDPRVKSLVLTLFIAGFGTKAALVPFHSWLPDALSPSSISALLSGIFIKTLGIYALVRIIFNVIGLTPQGSLALMALGAISILIGGILSVGQKDIKRLMAYSSISHIGTIIAAFALATPLGLMGGMFHAFNHALIKPLLFFNAGAVEKGTGTRDLTKLGGLFSRIPIIAATAMIGALAISGLPPFNGFWSKLFIIFAFAQAGNIFMALVVVAGSILTLAAYLKLLKGVFFGPVASEVKERTPLTMIMPLVVLAFVCFGIGLFVPLVSQYLINPAVISVFNGTGYGKLILGVN